MQNSKRKFLDFNGKEIEFVFADGKWWVAIKPICEALGVHYKAQHKAILEDEILSQLSSEQRIVAADGKTREMTCLPERYIYGWVYALRSESEELRKYKMKCYDVLYDYFEGLLTRRQVTVSDKHVKLARKEALEEALLDNPDYAELQDIKSELGRINKSLKEQDEELLKRQGNFFSEE